MFIVVKKRTVLLLVLAVVIAVSAVGLGAGYSQTTFVSQKKGYTVVIDAGHGGADPGVIAENGMIEAELNLNISLLLQRVLSDADMNAVMTRKTADGLYGEDLNRFKARDFAQRRKIILEADPDMVVSIHTNKFPGNKNRRGIQVFYNKASAEGQRLAQTMQNSLNVLNREYVGKNFSALEGEYFMLNCTQKPSVIVECGFFGNAEDEALLSQESYRKAIAESVYLGIVDFINYAY